MPLLLDVLATTWRADLAFLASLAVWTAVIWVAARRLAPAWREPLLLGASLAFMVVMLPPALVVFLVAFVVLLREVCLGSLRHDRLWRVLAAGLLLGVYVPVCWQGTFLAYSQGRIADESLLPYLLLWLSFRKCLWFVYEVHTERITEATHTRVLLHQFFLPFLGGRSPVVAYTTLWKHWDPSPSTEQLRHGATTLVLALSALMGRTALTLIATGLALDLGFGRNLEERTALAIWATLDLAYVRKYLYRYGFEQSSVGLLRLFGFHLADNYANPLMARSYAELWRRWNLHFRDLVVGIFYYPVLLPLARRWPGGKEFAVALAVAVTFAGHALLLFQSLSMSLDPADPATRWQMFSSLALFDVFQAALVLIALYGAALLPGWLTARPRLTRALGVFTTFHLRAMVFLFFQKGTVVPPHRAIRVVARAFGLRR